MYPVLIAVLSALFIFTLVLAAFRLAARKKLSIQQRVKALLSNAVQSDDKAPGRKERQAVKAKPLLNLGSELAAAGIKLRVEEFVVLWLLCAFGPAALCFLLGTDILVPLALLIIGTALPIMLVRRSKNKRIHVLEEQLANALIIISNCLQTGLSFQQSLDRIVREMPEPISIEFGRVAKEIQLGLSMEKAMENMAVRLSSEDFKLIVSAVLIQRQSGGNLSEILTNISETIRERFKIKANLKVLTSTGRTSGKVVGAMPLFLLLILMLINPAYVWTFFTTTAGMILLAVACALEVIGFLAIRKIMKFKY
jgi:tight adherence protein B